MYQGAHHFHQYKLCSRTSQKYTHKENKYRLKNNWFMFTCFSIPSEKLHFERHKVMLQKNSYSLKTQPICQLVWNNNFNSIHTRRKVGQCTSFSRDIASEGKVEMDFWGPGPDSNFNWGGPQAINRFRNSSDGNVSFWCPQNHILTPKNIITIKNVQLKFRKCLNSYKCFMLNALYSKSW